MEPGEPLDIRPDDQRWGHSFGPGAGTVNLHYITSGRGRTPLVLLHGWPGFWYDWRHVIPRLQFDASLIAPDLRGFGDSDKPDLPPSEGYTPEALADDVLALMDHVGFERAVVAAHDLGATVAQALARRAPDRVAALALFNPPYPGIGMRRFEPAAQAELWYQHLHAQPWADRLIGYELGTVDLYVRGMYEHWVGRHERLREAELEWIVQFYARPGAIRGSLAYYRARAGARLAEAAVEPAAWRVTQPTVVLWGEADPVMRVEWSDRLAEFFPNLLSLTTLPGVGHFVPFEAPVEATTAIRQAIRAAG
jgi:pimeloyl-ACP methyl ester carboxylesterase